MFRFKDLTTYGYFTFYFIGISGRQLSSLERMVDEIIRMDPPPTTVTNENDYIASSSMVRIL